MKRALTLEEIALARLRLECLDFTLRHLADGGTDEAVDCIFDYVTDKTASPFRPSPKAPADKYERRARELLGFPERDDA